jgi:predicted DNA-binding transcriptional regulator AlpA
MTDYNTSGRNNHARAIIDHATANVAAVEDELLTIAEVADVVRVPVATLRYWRHLGTGPHSFRIGRGVRYWRSEVSAWLHGQSDRPTVA